MKELMIHVERIVRPIRADWSKLRIRRELLAHLQAAFDEERSRGLEDAAALAEAKRRLGEPEALSREIQASVSRLEQLAVTPFPRLAATTLIVACILIPLIAAVAFVPAMVRSGQARGGLVASVLTLETSALLWYLFLIEFFRPRVRWGRIVGPGVGAVITQIAGMSLLTYSVAGRAGPHEVADAAQAALATLGFCGAMGIVAMLGKWRAKRWLDLDIAG